MSSVAIPEALLDDLVPELANWVRGLGLHRRPGLAAFFSTGELQSGSAAMELHNELGCDEGVFVRFAQDLDRVVHYAQTLAEQRRRGFAMLADHSLHWERMVRQRRESADLAEARFRELDLRRQRAAAPPHPLRPRLAHRHRRGLPGDGLGREESEDVARKYWIARIHRLLQELEAPILNIVSASSRPLELLDSHFAGRRSRTLGARVRAWVKYRAWLRHVFGVGYPQAPHHLLDYLMDRRAEPCTRGTLSAVYATQRFLEHAMGLSEGDKWTSCPRVQGMIRGIIAGAAASVGQRSVGPANSPLIEILAKLETLVCDVEAPADQRVLAWWMSASAWSSFRFDDHRGMSPHLVQLRDGDADFVVERSKTTGKDKAVLVRRTVVSGEAWFVERHWLREGLKVLLETVRAPRDFLLAQFGTDGSPLRREMNYAEYAGRMRAVLSRLPDGGGHDLGGEFSTYLRPHSWRAFLPSAIIALGGPTEGLKWLSAWKSQSADSYVRTSRARTITLQSTVARLVRLHRGGKDPMDEKSALSNLELHLRERGCDEEEVKRIVSGVTAFPDGSAPAPLWPALFPEGPSHDESGSSADGQATVDPQINSEDETAGKPPTDGYVIAISRRRKTRCLHKIGLCYRIPGRHYVSYEEYGGTRPGNDTYDDFCKDCWRPDKASREQTTAEGLGSDTGSSRRTSSSSESDDSEG